MMKRIEIEVNAAATRAEEIAAPPLTDAFTYTFAELPADLAQQRDSMQTHSLASEATVTSTAASPGAGGH